MMMLHDLTRCAENVSRSSKRAATIPRQARRLDVAAERTSGHADLADRAALLRWAQQALRAS